MLKIGLTGGLGSGKSTASAMLAKLGSYIFDADAEAKIILDSNKKVQKDIVGEFGSDVIDKSGLIDRKKLAQVAFQDEDHSILLNAIIHPYIFKAMDVRYEKIAVENEFKNFVVDGALVFESGMNQHLDYIILIASLLKFRLGRALKRGNLTRDDILRRIDLQWTDKQKAEMSDYVIHNNGTEVELEEAIKKFFKREL